MAGLQVYLHPASRRFGRGGATFRAGSHTSSWLSLGLRFFSSKLHVCEREEKPQLTPQRQYTSGSHSNCTPRLAIWLLSVLTVPRWRQWPRRDIHTHSLTGITDNARVPGHQEKQSTMALALGEQTGVPAAQIPTRSSKMTTEMAGKSHIFFPIFNALGPRKVTFLSTACNRGGLLLRKLNPDKKTQLRG